MTISMMLEVEQGENINTISWVLSKMGASYDQSDNFLKGNLKQSNCFFSFNYCVKPERIVAEQAKEGWLVGINGIFDCRIDSLKECADDIELFLRIFFKKSKSRFVLSFQYESIYAVRGISDVMFIKRMIDD